jgi:hypothetical protein
MYCWINFHEYSWQLTNNIKQNTNTEIHNGIMEEKYRAAKGRRRWCDFFPLFHRFLLLRGCLASSMRKPVTTQIESICLASPRKRPTFRAFVTVKGWQSVCWVQIQWDMFIKWEMQRIPIFFFLLKLIFKWFLIISWDCDIFFKMINYMRLW